MMEPRRSLAPAGVWLGLACVWAVIALIQVAVFLKSDEGLVLVTAVLAAVCTVLALVKWRRVRDQVPHRS